METKKLETECLNCQKKFSYYRAKTIKKYCSWECRYPNHVSVQLECDFCGKETTRSAWQIKRSKTQNRTKFCDLQCRRSFDRQNRSHICKVCSVVFYDKPGKYRRYCSKKCSPKNIDGLKIGWKDTSNRIKKGQFAKEKHPSWKGGITKESKLIRCSVEYKLWRISILERDNYTCQICNKRGGNLNVDHIKPFSRSPELRLEINNGRTLCLPCHRQVGWKYRPGIN